MSWKHGVTWLLILGGASGCMRGCQKDREEMTPEEVVEAYLETALNMADASEREELMGYATGNLKAAIAGASDETIRAAYLDRKYKLMEYSVLERRDRTPRETEIGFQLKYRDLTGAETAADEAPVVTTENTVSVVREKERWLLRDVIGAKTAIDFPLASGSRVIGNPNVPPVEPPPME